MNSDNILQAEIEEILARVEELADVANDPQEFSRLRREILDSYIGLMEPSRAEQNRAMQAEIENTCAVSGSPTKAARTLLQMGSDLANAIDNFKRTLDG